MSGRLRSARSRAEHGVVLVSVLFFVLLMAIGLATFQRRASIDSFVAKNRDRAAQAETAARGGVRLALALLLEDRLAETAGVRAETRQDFWAQAEGVPLELPGGATLRLRIEDEGSRVNLNALVQGGELRDPLAETFLETLLEKVRLELEGSADQTDYDSLELARNLLDWLDADDVRIQGGPEDAYYQGQEPPYRAANRPLLSVDELRLIEGFDARLVEALRPYVSVHPIAGGDGVNPNTAPTYVLATLYHGGAGDYRLASLDTLRDVLDMRTAGAILCDESATNPECTPVGEAIQGEIFPPPRFSSDVFRVASEATVGEVTRTVDAVIDRSEPAQPRVLAWKVH